MAKFKLNKDKEGNYPTVNLLKNDGTSERIDSGKEYNVSDFQANDILYFSQNGKKEFNKETKKMEWAYLPTISVDDDVNLEPNVPSIDLEESVSQEKIVYKSKEKTK